MQKLPSHKTKHFLTLVIKLFIVIGCGYFIYLKVTDATAFYFSDFSLKKILLNVLSLKNCSLLLLFTFLNWWLEILKWKTLSASIHPQNFKTAAIQSLASLTVSLITPNRIGEYGAKALYFNKPLRKQVMALNLVGNLSQLTVTVFFGILGVLYYITQQHIVVPFSQFAFSITITGTCIAALFFGAASFLLGRSYLKKTTQFLAEIPVSKKLQVGTLSLLRFIVFSHQFYFLLVIFNVDIAYIDAITSIFLCYFISSIIPILSLFDIVLKSSVAIWVFSFYTVNPSIIIAVTLLMWMLNFALPASIGSYFVLRFNTKSPLLRNISKMKTTYD